MTYTTPPPPPTFYITKNNNNNTNICKAHIVSIRAESEALHYINKFSRTTGASQYQSVSIMDSLQLRMTEVVVTTVAV